MKFYNNLEILLVSPVMFTSISGGFVKSLGSRRISHLIAKNYVRKYSPYVKKFCASQSLFCHSETCLLPLRWHTVFNTSELHGISQRSPSISGSAQKISTSRICNYQTKSKDFNKEDDDNSEVENKGRTVLDDLEFQSILKDFAHDFGVDDKTRPFLEEIKEQHSPFDDDAKKPSGKDCRNDSAVRTTKCAPLSDNKFHELGDSPSVQDLGGTKEDHEFYHIDQELEERDEYDAKRGKEGVYDVGDLVTVLRKENLADICVIQVPASFHYADYLVLATAKSPRHCRAIVEFIIKLYKKKKNKKDAFIICEGKTATTWKALDMGNIVLHIFLEDTRDFYDIESLWLLDKKYDNVKSITNDPHLNMMQQHMDFLNSLNQQ